MSLNFTPLSIIHLHSVFSRPRAFPDSICFITSVFNVIMQLSPMKHTECNMIMNSYSVSKFFAVFKQSFKKQNRFLANISP